MESKDSGGGGGGTGAYRPGSAGGVGGGGGGALSPRGALTTGSATIVAVEEKAAAKEDNVLRLRLDPRPHVKWEEGVVDNEHMNKKSSKRCCIFHKKRAFGESSSEESSGSESEGEGDNDDDDQGPGSGGGGKGKKIGASSGGKKKGDTHMHVAQPKHPPIKPHETYHA